MKYTYLYLSLSLTLSSLSLYICVNCLPPMTRLSLLICAGFLFLPLQFTSTSTFPFADDTLKCNKRSFSMFRTICAFFFSKEKSMILSVTNYIFLPEFIPPADSWAGCFQISLIQYGLFKAIEINIFERLKLPCKFNSKKISEHSQTFFFNKI